jgi:hypothetical protein
MVTYDTKIGVVVRHDLAIWQKLNVGCFLMVGLTKTFPEIAGEPYADANQVSYLSLARQPILIFGAEKDELLNVTGAGASPRSPGGNLYGRPFHHIQ